MGKRRNRLDQNPPGERLPGDGMAIDAPIFMVWSGPKVPAPKATDPWFEVRVHGRSKFEPTER